MTAGGAIAGAISIPTRHIHQVIEMVHKDDVEASINLLKMSIEQLDQWSWSHQ
jgi:endoglucanase